MQMDFSAHIFIWTKRRETIRNWKDLELCLLPGSVVVADAMNAINGTILAYGQVKL